MDGDSKEKHRLEKDGVLSDGVSYYPASEQDLAAYKRATESLSAMQAPVLLDSKNANSRLYVAAFDGTGNDAVNDPEHLTNVARIHQSIEKLSTQSGSAIASGYVAGPGTQSNWLDRTIDGANGHTYDERLEQMYAQFINKAWEWKRENPDADIRIASTGFSRGAEQAAGFTRLVHERGIQDPTGAVYERDNQGQIKSVAYGKPPIVEPGNVAQAVALFDPVGTGEPVKDKDRRLPPSVLSGVQIISESERRGLFKSTHIIDPGMSEDGRFLGVVVAGAHSDIGGSYHRDGLSTRNGNFASDYLNSLGDKPFLEKRPESNDPSLNVIHRSEEGMFLYKIGSKVDRLQPEGYVERLVPKRDMPNVADPFNAEPRNEALNSRFERQQVNIGALPESPAGRNGIEIDRAQLRPDQPGHPDHGLHQQIRSGVEKLDAQHGRSFDAVSERITASLLPVAKEGGLNRVDHVLLSRDGPQVSAGEKLFVVQGQLDDPSRRMAHMNSAEAARTPVEASFQKLDQVNQQTEQRTQEQLSQEQRNHNQSPRALGMQ